MYERKKRYEKVALVHPCTRDIRASCTSKSPLISKPQIKTWGSPRQSAVLTGTCLRDFLDSVWKTCTVRVGFALPDVFTRICPIFVPIRSRSLFQTRLYRLLPCNRTSCIHAVVDAGRFGLHVLGNCSCIALLLYIPVHILRHFLHPAGRIHQHDEVRT